MSAVPSTMAGSPNSAMLSGKFYNHISKLKIIAACSRYQVIIAVVDTIRSRLEKIRPANALQGPDNLLGTHSIVRTSIAKECREKIYNLKTSAQNQFVSRHHAAGNASL